MAFGEILAIGCITFGAGALFGSLRQHNPAMQDSTGDQQTPAVFLFEDGSLRDLTDTAEVIMTPENSATVGALAGFLSDAFPEITAAKLEAEELDLTGADGRYRITSHSQGSALRISVWGLAEIAINRQNNSVSLLDDIHDHAPQLVWQQDPDGHVVWSNAAYRKLVATVAPAGGVLFPDLASAQTQRLSPTGNDEQWFDITTIPTDTGRLTCLATETTELVRADENRREYVRTLGRTFADLATGLAIFDRNRQLKMFNPAMLEMSRLPFAFLSARPRIDTVLDRLRELQMMPEPKDYASWRDQFTAVEAGAKQGTYCETWALPDGQTFRVTGRPHPDGAFALLFEDITTEITHTRRFRTELETGQAVLDNLPDAVAVFSPSGTLVMMNAAYGRLWGGETLYLRHRDLESEVALWEGGSIATNVWSDILHTANQETDRRAWTGDTLLTDGRPLRCFATPLDGGMTLVRFSFTPVVRPQMLALPAPQSSFESRGG